MPLDNRVSAEITAAVKAQILTKITEIRDLLPFLLNLTADERRSIPSMSTARGAMDDAFAQQIAAHPELVPTYVDTTDLPKDRALRLDLLELSARVGELAEGLADTAQAAGSDVYMAFMSFYANVQQAARRGVAGADAILTDLQRFIPRGPRNPPAPAPPSP